MADPFIGEIKMVGFTFAMRGWAFCNGQLLSIAQNTALFSLLGTTFGGDGQTTFALPNLQDRAPLHFGQGPGLSPFVLGEMGGTATYTLAASEAGHTHVVQGTSNQSAATAPANNLLASKGRGGANIYDPGTGVTLDPSTVSVSPGGSPHDNLQPYLGINFVIALEGIYPSRN